MPKPKERDDDATWFLSPISGAEKRAAIRDGREIDLAALSDGERMARGNRNWVKLVAVSTWLHDSIAWMEAAVYMDNESRRCRPDALPTDHHRANVAHVSAGYAFELLMKSIAKADDVEVQPRHSVQATFAKLGEQRKHQIRQAVATHGVFEVEEFLATVDDRLCHKDRKYGMFKTDMWTAGGTYFDTSDGPGSISGFARVHREIASLGRGALEEWRGIHSREFAEIRASLSNKSGQRP